MPNHEMTRCEIKEFDEHTFRTSAANGGSNNIVKEGEVHKISYNWLGEWEKRPQIFKFIEIISQP